MPFSLIRAALRPSRSWSLLAESVRVRQYPQEKGVKIESTSPTGTHTIPWHHTGCTQGCWARCLVSLLGLSLKCSGNWGSFLLTENRQQLQLSSRRARRRTLVTTSASASPQHLGGNGTNPPERHFKLQEETARNSQPGFIKGKSYLTNLTAPCGEITDCVDVGGTVVSQIPWL